MTPPLLLPQPQRIEDLHATAYLTGEKLIVIPSPDLFFTAQRVQAALAKVGARWGIAIASASLPAEQIGLQFAPLDKLPSGTSSDNTPYQLEIRSDAIVARAATPAGHFYAACTLIQILEQSGAELPCLRIEDRADFPRRGVMLDISRDKVPTLETLYGLIDMLASWKINEVQLYTEHTFAYRKHRTVWENASPMTGEDILALDRFCRERFVDLVPNQNSFGHMHRWLMHEEYAHLAETAEGLDWPMFLTRRPFSLAPAVPESIRLVEQLYNELLPHFSSRYFNVGCDETFDLGRGRSKELVAKHGVGRVYLEFLQQIHALVSAHGRTMMFWGDIVMQHPELVSELPKDVIAMEWGYEAEHPFDRDGARFAEAGIRFYVCPGTSSWISLVGRTQNALGNLLNAAENGKKYGAMGYLNTDWGDYGHWQPLPVSYAGFAYGAGVSWAVEANRTLDLGTVLNRFAFRDPAGVMGPLALEMGDAYRIVADLPHENSAAMARALYSSLEKIRSGGLMHGKKGPHQVDVEKLRAAMGEIDRLAARLSEARPTDPQVIADYQTAAMLWRHGCKRLIKAADDAAYGKAELAAELRGLMSDFAANWLARNRPGGLGDSLTRMTRLIAEYEQ